MKTKPSPLDEAFRFAYGIKSKLSSMRFSAPEMLPEHFEQADIYMEELLKCLQKTAEQHGR